MSKLLVTTSAIAMAMMSGICQAEINIIPKPNYAEEFKGQDFTFNKFTAIRYDNRLKSEAEMLATAIENITGTKPRLVDEKLRILLHSEIRLDLSEDSKGEKEGYTLRVKGNNIHIEGSKNAGVFYGVQSLLQLIPQEGEKIVQGCEIVDAPRFGWRGMHLDVGRHMFKVDDIKKFIDWLAVHKMNSFHWHLTEDQGWRIEIKKYPKLTEVGGFRASTPPYGNRNGSDGKRYGGFYTQEEIKEVVAYAKKRHVTVVPEIDMPGHMAAAIAAYPWLGCDDIPNYKPEVMTKWGVHPYVLSPKEETFKWVDDVLTEVCALFPSTYIHIGGDEAPKGQWKQSKFAQSVIKREKLHNEHELQSYFIGRLEKMLEKKGRKLIGWDEIREGGLSPNATMMLWRGWNHAIASINEGHDVVMAPGSHTYFDHYQATPKNELAKGVKFECIGGFQPIKNVYSFDPVPKQFKGTAKEKHVLGCQAQLWTEYMKTWDKVEYCAFPRIAALSEVAWTKMEHKDYKDFSRRMKPMMKRYKAAGINAFDDESSDEISIELKDGVKVSSSMVGHSAHPLEGIYDGDDKTYFWSGREAFEGDFVKLELKKPLGKAKVSVATGSQSSPHDTMQNGVLECSADGKKWTTVAAFKKGVAAGELPAKTKFIRLRSLKGQSNWLLVKDIKIEK